MDLQDSERYGSHHAKCDCNECWYARTVKRIKEQWAEIDKARANENMSPEKEGPGLTCERIPLPATATFRAEHGSSCLCSDCRWHRKNQAEREAVKRQTKIEPAGTQAPPDTEWTVDDIRAENARLAAEHKQVHEQNSRLVGERMDMKKTKEQAERSAAAWQETARQAQENADYYRSLLVTIGGSIGSDAYRRDDGTIGEDVLCCGLPELVDNLVYRAGLGIQIDVQLSGLWTDTKAMTRPDSKAAHA